MPESVTLFLIERGHTIIRVTELMLSESPDQIIAVTGDRLGAIVVTWDKDFRRLAARISKEGEGKLRRLSRINFRCREPLGRVRIEQEIEGIEQAYLRRRERHDKRLLVEIKERNITYW